MKINLRSSFPSRLAGGIHPTWVPAPRQAQGRLFAGTTRIFISWGGPAAHENSMESDILAAQGGIRLMWSPACPGVTRVRLSFPWVDRGSMVAQQDSSPAPLSSPAESFFSFCFVDLANLLSCPSCQCTPLSRTAFPPILSAGLSNRIRKRCAGSPTTDHDRPEESGVGSQESEEQGMGSRCEERAARGADSSRFQQATDN